MTCLVLIVGGWPSLLCTIAALCVSYNVSILLLYSTTVKPFFLHQARDDEKRGNISAARTKANISLCLNIAAVVFVVVVWSVVAIPVAVTFSAQPSAAQLSAISTPSTVRPTPSTVPPTTRTTSSPTPYCYSALYSSICYIQYCYSSYSYYSCSYYSYYTYSSYSYSYSSYPYYYSQSCGSNTYSLICLYG